MIRGDVEQVYRGNLDRLLERVRKLRGLDMTRYRRRYVERRVGTRLLKLGLHSYRQYGDYLERHPEEFERLIDALTINVTGFFRDAEVYERIDKEILPRLVGERAASSRRTIRVWSAGCATGEETYSVAMALLSAIGSDDRTLDTTFVGTDVDEKALARARSATYAIDRMKEIPEAMRVHCCDVEADTFRIGPEVRRHVEFRASDLFLDDPVAEVDLILCRNVFIYFNRDQQEHAIDVLESQLVSGGYLVLGRSEKLPPHMTGRLELISGRERIYRKRA